MKKIASCERERLFAALKVPLAITTVVAS